METKTIIQEGDIVVFDDKHMIFCGDSSKIESYDFMKGKKATLCFTSPPYNVGSKRYGSNLTNVQKFVNDSQDIRLKLTKYYVDNDSLNDKNYLDLIINASKNALQNCEYLFFNVAHNSGNKISLIDYCYEMKDKYVDTIIWKKDVSLPVIVPNVLNSDFEYIYIYKQNPNDSKQIKIGKDFHGTLSNVIEIKRNMQNEYAKIHSSLMPLELCDYIINNFTNENDIVLDCFSGLATTMISCITNNRIYRGIEISPFYVQESIKRFMEYSNDRNIKILRGDKVINYKEIEDYISSNRKDIFDYLWKGSEDN